MKFDLINEVMQEDTIIKFMILLERSAPEIFTEPPENISAGIDLLKHIIDGKGGIFDDDDIIYAIKVYRYLVRLILNVKEPLSDEYDAINLAKKYHEKGLATAIKDPKQDI